MAVALLAPAVAWGDATPPLPSKAVPPVEGAAEPWAPVQPPSAGEPIDQAHHSEVADTLSLLTTDVDRLRDRDLPSAERMRLALEVRAQAGRLPNLTVGRPAAARQCALDVEHASGHLLDAVVHRDEQNIARQASALTTEVSRLRAMLGP